jgi:hypothetical protein
MCPACIAAAAVTAAKVASAGGLAAYGIKKLLATAVVSLGQAPLTSGEAHETAEHRLAR